MSRYNVVFSDQAKKDIAKLKKSEPTAYKKIRGLLIELAEHPYTGTGKPKLLKHEYAERFSRRITQKHRLVYTVDESIVTVNILATIGHYDDK